jgi:integrase
MRLPETGVRVGELCGLRVDDINPERSLLIVQRSACRVALGSPKTPSSIRTVNLYSQCIEHLRAFLRSWRPNHNRLLFAARTGAPRDANLLLKRKFRPLLKQLGIEVPHGNGFHAFRHERDIYGSVRRSASAQAGGVLLVAAGGGASAPVAVRNDAPAELCAAGGAKRIALRLRLGNSVAGVESWDSVSQTTT